jgi:putative ABC transport system permease protein
MRLFSRFANVFRARQVDRDIEEELQSHFEDAQAEGRDPAEVRKAFGSRLRARESVRDAIVSAWLESLVADAKFGLRQIGKHKVSAAAAILSLALGMGACMAAFRMIDALLLRPLPVADPDHLYALGSVRKDEFNGQTEVQYSFDYPGFRQLRAAVKDQASLMAISYPQRINLTYSSDDAMERVYLQYVSGWTFAEFGLKPALGRLLTEADDLAPHSHPYAVLSYDYWSARFGKDPHVLGLAFRTGNDVYQVVGVAPAGFTGTEPGTFTDLYAPTMMYNPEALGNQNWHWFTPWVRVRPGFDVSAVRERLRAALVLHRKEQAKAWPTGTPREIDEYVSAPVVLTSAEAGVSALQRAYARSLVILGLLVAMVLLIACVNVANLRIAQAAARAREMALRVSIGGGRARLVQLVLVENAWIAAMASALGAVFAWRAAPFVVGLINPVDQPVRLDLPTDFRITAFSVLLTLLVTMLFGLAPALRASGIQPASALKGGDDLHSRQRFTHGLLAAQVAFCVVVLMLTGLFVTTFQRLASQPLGFSSARVITLESVTPTGQRPDFWYQIADHLRSLAHVEDAAVAGFALMSGSGWNQNVWANGHSPEGDRLPWFLGVSPSWLDTMRIPLLQGRDFRPGDVFPSVAIVNQTFARRYFGVQSPVGKSLETILGAKKRVRVQIVGLAADARYTGMRGPIPATVYVPFRSLNEVGAPQMESWATFVVRTKDPNPMTLASSLRQEVKRARSEFRVANIRTQDELVRSQTIRERLLATLSLFFGLMALVLAGIGLYGVLNYAVTRRRHELGIRIALGARTKDVAGLIAMPIFALIALGTATGLVFAISTERFIASLLFGVKATDASMLLWPILALLAGAFLAALPAVVRAVRIDPATLLRSE